MGAQLRLVSRQADDQIAKLEISVITWLITQCKLGKIHLPSLFISFSIYEIQLKSFTLLYD